MRRNILMGLVYLMLLICFFASPAWAKEKPLCAVLTVKPGIGMTADEAQFTSDRLAGLIRQLDSFLLIERARIPQLLLDAGLDNTTPCQTMEQALAAGKAVGARFVIYGQVSHLGALYSLNTSMVDVENKKTIQTAMTDRKGDLTDFAESAPTANLMILLKLSSYPRAWPKPVRNVSQPKKALGVAEPVVAPSSPAEVTPPQSRRPVFDAAGTPRLIVKSVNKGKDGKYIALLEGIGVVKAGDVVHIKKGNRRYSWKITAVRKDGIAHTKVKVESID